MEIFGMQNLDENSHITKKTSRIIKRKLISPLSVVVALFLTHVVTS
jgi:hypothetical protein